MSPLRSPPRAQVHRLCVARPDVPAFAALLVLAALSLATAVPIGAPTDAIAKQKTTAANGKSRASTSAPAAAAPVPKAVKRKAVTRKAAAAKSDKPPKAKPGKPRKRAPVPEPPPTTAPTPTPAPAVAAAATSAIPAQPAAAAPSSGTGADRTRARTRRETGRRTAARGAAGGTRPSPIPVRPLRRSTASPVPAPAPSRGGLRERERSERSSQGVRQPESGSPVTRTVKDIVEVVPEALKVALVALLALSGVLGGGYLLAAARARRLDRQRAELLQEVGLLQTALLPPVPEAVGAMQTSVAYRPSDGPGAGGDFYDALTLSGGRAAFLLGDVSGHGRQALARTAFIRYTLRAYIEAGLEPRLALQLAGPVIGEHLGCDFATVVLAIHDPRNGSLTYACAGHPPPIVVGPTRPEPVVAASSLPIGLAMRTGVRQTTVPLPPGSVACLYTDGLAEARTEAGILGRPRLADILEELGRDATASALLDRVTAEARVVTDDMATVVLSPTAGVTAGGFREEQLEIEPDELEDGIGERFLRACGVEEELQTALGEAREWAASHGAALLHVRFGTRGPLVEVLPRNVQSLEAASRRRALA